MAEVMYSSGDKTGFKCDVCMKVHFINMPISIPDFSKEVDSFSSKHRKCKTEKEQKKQLLIDFLVWMNKVSADNPMVFETDNDDIAEMFLTKMIDVE